MNSLRLTLLAVVIAVSASPAAAQNTGSRFQVSLYPSSRMLATAGDTAEQPKFKTYSPSASVTMALGSHFALETDITAGRGNKQSLGVYGRQKSPDMIGGTVNGVLRLLPGGSVQPYITAGLGTTYLFKREEVGMTGGERLHSANAGGGVKILFKGWGVRADYRFVGMDAVDEERSTFFGPKTRYAHRISVGLMVGGR